MGQEKNFEIRIKQLLASRGCWFVKYWGGGLYTQSGVPDLLTCICGIFVGIELKADNGRPSDLQLRELHRIDESGGYALLLYPDDYYRFRELVDKIRLGSNQEIAVLYDKMSQPWRLEYERMANDSRI